MRNYMQFLVMEVHSLTDLHTEMFDENRRLLASSLGMQKHASYCRLPEAFDDGYELVPLEGGEQTALFISISSKGQRYYFSILGEEDKLKLLYKPVREILKFHLEKGAAMGLSLKLMRTAFFEELLGNEMTDDEVGRRSASLGLNLQNAYCVAAIDTCLSISEHAAGLGGIPPRMEEWLLRELQSRLPFEDCYIFSAAQGRIALVVDGKKPEAVKNCIESILQDAGERYKTDLCAGLSNPTGGYGDFHRAYKVAASICRLASIEKRPGAFFQGEVSMELLIDSIPYEMKKDFVDRIFQGCADADIDEWDNIVQVLHDNNGSISKSAEKLFIHKNTLQYRLNRIKERTGYDARNSIEAVTLRLALMVRKNTLLY